MLKVYFCTKQSTMRPGIFLIVMLFGFFLQGQDGVGVHKVNLSYDPANYGKSGFVLENITMAYQFKNCYRESHFLTDYVKSSVQCSRYYYNGKYYTSTDLGQEAFEKVVIDLGDFTADLYLSSSRLGTIEMKYVTGYLVGCFGDTYDFIKQLGLEHKDYIKDIDKLRVNNWVITRMGTQSYKVENIIKELEKKVEYESLMQQGDQQVLKGDLNAALDSFRKAKYLTEDQTQAQAKIDEVEKLKKEQKTEKQFQDLMSKGDQAMDEENFSAAESYYKGAKDLKPESSEAQSKYNLALAKKEEALEKDSEEAEEETNNQRSSEEGSQQKERDNGPSEEERARQEEYERQKRVQEHYQLRQEQMNDNMASASEMGASAIMLHLLIGKLIYGGMGNDKEHSRLLGDSYHMSVFGGYGFSSRPVFFNSSYEIYDGLNYYFNEQTENHDNLTLDLQGGFEIWPLMGRSRGWGGSVSASLGHGILFQNFSFGAELGLKGYFGVDEMQLYGEYSIGTRGFDANGWIDPSELGEGAKGGYEYGRLLLGPRFSFDAELKGETRGHLIVGPVFEYNSKEPRNFGNDPLVFNWNNGFHASFWFENRMKIFMEYFWDYVRTGDVEYSYDDEATFSGTMVRFGALRSLDMFGETSYSYDYKQIKKLCDKKNKTVLYLANPTINWIKTVNDSIYQNEFTIGINPIGIEKEFNVQRWLALSAGAVLGVNQGGRYNVSENNTLDVNGLQFGANERIRHQIMSIDVPISGKVYLNYSGFNRYWIAAGISRQFNLYSIDGVKNVSSDYYEQIEDPTSGLNLISNNRFIQFGLDFSTNGSSLVRVGAKLNDGQTALFESNDIVKSNSISLNFALIF